MLFRIAIGGLAAAALGGLVFLAVGASSSEAIEVDPGELAKAKAAFERGRPLEYVAPERPAETRGGSTGAVEAEPSERPPIPIPGKSASPARPILPSLRYDRVGPGSEFNQRMTEANHAYDRRDYEQAVEIAAELLETRPNNVRMLRVAVSANCILSNLDEAGRYYAKLPARDQQQMATRCRRYDVFLD